MNWIYQNKEIKSVDDLPPNTFGFVYFIKFNDNTKYVGKKQIYSISKSKKKESKWKTYQGSCKLCKNKIPVNKFILAFASTRLYLTYLELKYQLLLDVLENEDFLNDNVLGKFYTAKLKLDKFYPTLDRDKNTN